MAWVFEAGARRIEFTGETSGLGLVDFPEVEIVGEQEMFGHPRRDGRSAGRDVIAGQVVTLRVEARPDRRTLDEVWGELVAVWRGDDVRSRGGVLASLTSDSGRTVHGRPAPLKPDYSARLFGLQGAELRFECVSDLWFGEREATDIRFVSPASGGLTFPAEAPFTFDSGPVDSNGSVLVGGEVSAFPVFEILGPVTNPVVDVLGVGRLVFACDLKYDERLVVDTRPGARWVKRGVKGRPDSELVAFPGALSPSGARLADMGLRPGAHTIILRGYDRTATALLRVLVEPAYTSF